MEKFEVKAIACKIQDICRRQIEKTNKEKIEGFSVKSDDDKRIMNLLEERKHLQEELTKIHNAITDINSQLRCFDATRSLVYGSIDEVIMTKVLQQYYYIQNPIIDYNKICQDLIVYAKDHPNMNVTNYIDDAVNRYVKE